MLGVNEDLMAHTVAEAEDLFARIQARQAGPSPEGAQLTDSLLRVVEKDILRLPILKPLGPVLTRVLVGDKTAAMLGLDVRHPRLVVGFHRLLAAFVRVLQIALSPLSQPFQPAAPLTARLGRRVVRCLCAATDDGRLREVAIPPGWR